MDGVRQITCMLPHRETQGMIMQTD